MNYVVRAVSGLWIASALVIGTGGCSRWWFPRRQAVNHYVNALSLTGAGFDEEAVEQLRQAVSLDRDFATAHSLLGDLHRQSGRLEEAADAYENACRLDPYAFSDHFHLGQVYQWLKRFPEAIVVLRQACRLQPDHVEANYVLGISYFEIGRYEAAADYCDRAARLDPGNPLILTSLGDIHSRGGDPEKAIAAFKQALEIDGQQVDILLRLGSAYLDAEQFAAARLIFEKAIHIAPDESRTYLASAYGLLVEGNHHLALSRPQDGPPTPADLERETEPHRQAKGFYQDALMRYAQARQLEPDNHLVYNGLGVACMMMYLNNRADTTLFREALAHWEYSLQLVPDQPKIQALLEKYSTPDIR